MPDETQSGLPIPEVDFCAFCSALSEEPMWPAIVAVHDDVLVYVPPEQRGALHLLVIPLRHAPTLLDLERHEVIEVALAVQRTAAAVVRLRGPRGVHVYQNNGTGTGQTVPHVHFHVSATWEDPDRPTFGPGDSIDLEMRRQLADEVRAAFA